MRLPWMGLLVATSFAAAPAAAQRPEDAAISVTVGVGVGWARVSCNICQTSRDRGPSAFVRVSKPLRPALRVGAEATHWTNEVADEREHLAALMALLSVQPNEGPLFFEGGAGYVGYRAGDDIGMNALGVQLGTGYAFQLAGLPVNGYLDLIASSFGSLTGSGSTIARGVGTTLLQAGIALTVR